MIEKSKLRPGRRVRPIAPLSSDATAISLLFMTGVAAGMFVGLVIRIFL